MYTIGIDVGGTNTDAALIKGREVAAMAKIPTEHSDLFSSTSTALEEILKYYRGSGPIRLHLSTTLSTNLIVEGKGAPAAIAAVPGPGVNLDSLGFSFPIYQLDGYIDHRGREVSPLDPRQAAALRGRLEKEGQALGIVGKFSHRNPSHEQQLYAWFSDWFPGIISCGHRLSGQANFPRRIVTTYLNSSVAGQQLEFAGMWQRLSERLAVDVKDILILKADGGTMTLKDSQRRPIETILSGPAASIMGVRALTECRKENFVIIDIGGTTTDLAAVVQSEVLFERDGATIAGNRTLVPALLVRSVGLGGDSAIRYLEEEGRLILGPQRAGIPVCLGGSEPTPTDAAAALGLAAVGSREKAIGAWKKLGSRFNLEWKDLAQRVITAFINQLSAAVEALYTELENVPLYTVSEILTPPRVRPQAVVGLGAPAPVFIPRLAQKLDLPWETLRFAPGANAIGAAAAGATVGITLHADTELGTVAIPEMGYQGKIKRPLFFELSDARQLALAKIKEYAAEQGYEGAAEAYIVEEESFHMVRGFHTVGKIHMARAQLRPRVMKIEGGGSSG